MSLTLRPRPKRSREGTSYSDQMVPVDTWEDFRREVDRSRRFERPLTLLMFRYPRFVAREEEELVGEVSEKLRSIDRTWEDGNGLFVLLPETDRAGADRMCRRLLDDVVSLRSMDVWVSTFPSDGVTVGAVLGNLRALTASQESPHPHLDDAGGVPAIPESSRWR